MKRQRKDHIALALLISSSSCAAPVHISAHQPQAPEAAITADASTDEPRPDIPNAARDVIWKRMQGHGSDMTMLLWAVLFLDYEAATEISRVLIAEPRFSRPVRAGDDTINAQIPERFYALQDELQLRAKDIIEVATEVEPDAASLARAYGALAETCVKCHAEYLYERPEREVFEAISARMLNR